MRRREMLELEDRGITDEIRDLAYKDFGVERIRKYYWGQEMYTAYKIHSYMTAREVNGILKLEIYYGQNIRKHDEEPEYIIFLSKIENKYNTYIWKEKKWSRAKLENLRFRGCNYRDTYGIMLWCSEEDADTIRRYLNTEGEAVSAIKTWQTNVMHKKEIQEIDHVMNQITETPEDFDQWVREEVFWRQQYIFYNAQEKKAYCTACKQMMPTKIKSIHNRCIICPACGRKVTAKSWNKQKSLLDDQVAALIQKIPAGIIVRKFSCRKRCEVKDDWKERVYILETDRQLYNIRMNPIRGYEYANFKQTGETRWCNSKYINMMGRAVVYPKNIKDIRTGTELSDVPLELMLDRQKGEKVSIQILLKPGDITKHLIRSGLTKLAIETMGSGLCKEIEKSGQNAQEALGINRDRINRLKSINGGRVALGWLQYEQKTEIKIPQKILERLEDHGISRSDLDAVLNCGVTPERALNYIEKQTRGQSDVLVEWRDYLKMAKEERMEMYDDIVRMPKDLRRRHNELVELRNKKENEKKLKGYRKIDREIKKHIDKAEIYYWEDKNYIIAPAAKCEELMIEGRILHHCVGASDTYMKKMAAGITWILFLRRKEDLDNPWYTIEIDMKTDRILQWYSEYDRKPEREKVKKILDKFLGNVRKKRKQEHAKMANVCTKVTA